MSKEQNGDNDFIRKESRRYPAEADSIQNEEARIARHQEEAKQRVQQRRYAREQQKKRNKKLKRKNLWIRLMWIGISLIGFVIVFTVACNIYVVKKYSDRILTVEACKEQKADCIMVLGALVYEDGRPCHMLQDRLNRGIELYQNGVSDRLLMTGDHGQIEYDEVNVMKQYAVDAGVMRDDIFMDHAGFSTYDSMYRAKAVFGVKKMIIVTQRYHMPRALYIANKLGIDAYGVCAEDITYSGQAMRDVREIAARIKDIWSVLWKPDPKYLGEAIPISGSGAFTDDQTAEEK